MAGTGSSQTNLNLAQAPNNPTEQSNFDLGIWYTISLWPALSVAVSNNWGGPDSAGKRDWFAGAVSDLFEERPDTDVLDVESVLLQVMQDEFDVNVEDESEIPVAAEIMKLRKEIFEEGNLAGVEDVKRRFEARGGRTERVNVVDNRKDEAGDDVDSSSDEEDEDVEMGEASAPQLVRARPEPEIDEDGFQTVVGKKKR